MVPAANKFITKTLRHSLCDYSSQNTASLIAFFRQEDFRPEIVLLCIFSFFLDGRFARTDGYIIWNISVNTVHTAEAFVH